jgi:hypothetical protein
MGLELTVSPPTFWGASPPSTSVLGRKPGLRAASQGAPHPLLGGPAQPPGPVPGPVAATEGEECASSLPEGEGASHLAAAHPQEWGHKAGI